jgi:hypothetical protein
MVVMFIALRDFVLCLRALDRLYRVLFLLGITFGGVNCKGD